MNYLRLLSIQEKLIFLLFVLVFSATLPSLAQVDTQNQLVNPELFERFLPEELPGNWKKSGFSSRTSASENWGGVSYMGDGATFMQVGIRHFTHSKWDENKTEAREEDKTIEIGNYTGYLGETMGQAELVVYFGNNFSARIVGSELTEKDLKAVLNHIPLEKINALVDSKKKTSNKKTKSEPTSESLRSILPDTLAGMMHGRIRSAPNKPIVAVTYGNDDLPYSVNIQIATGDPRDRAKTSLKEELNETNTDLRKINHNGHKLWFREEESAVSFSVFLEELVLFIAADAPANSSFDMKAAHNHLLAVFDELETGM